MLTKLKYKLWKHLNKQFTNNKVEQNLEFLNNIVQNINNTTINAVDTAKQLMIGVNVDIVEKLLKINEVNVAIFQYLTGIEFNKDFVKEREIVFNPQNTPPDHYKRYCFARDRLKSSEIVLDCACGCGYGSSVLAQSAGKVIGIDLEPNGINFASKVFRKDNLQFIAQDAQNLTINETFDALITFETIEHIPQYF